MPFSVSVKIFFFFHRFSSVAGRNGPHFHCRSACVTQTASKSSTGACMHREDGHYHPRHDRHNIPFVPIQQCQSWLQSNHKRNHGFVIGLRLQAEVPQDRKNGDTEINSK